MAPQKTANRRCDSCQGAMPARTSRQRDDKGRLVCDSCKANPQPEWTTTHSSLSILDQSEMRRREAEALTSIVRVRQAKHSGRSVVAHDGGDMAVIHHCFACGSGAVVGNSDGTATCDFCHTNFTVQVQPAHPFMPQTIDGEPVVPPGMPGGEETELSAPTDPAVEEDGEDVAADPLGDADPNPSSAETRNKAKQPGAKPPPFEKEKKKPSDGGGSKPPWLKNKKSSRTAGTSETNRELDRALAEKAKSMTVTEFIRSQHPGGKGCTCPSVYRTCRWGDFWHRAQAGYYDSHEAAFRTAEGRTLDAEAYMARLALEHADDRDAVLDQVRMANMAREAAATGNCPKCEGEGDVANGVECDRCGGTGIVDLPDLFPRQASNPITCPTCHGDGRNPRDVVEPYGDCPTCRGTGEIDTDDPAHFELREPPHEASRR